ncbi:putative membrane protein [Synechococcus sp. BIOS-U3-1]|nr:putative membrane protein [Synechococcus sp. BIOS-U3-1]
MNLLQRMRVVGSGLIIAAYFITLHFDVVTGVIIHLTAMSISIPYFIKSKAWDVVIMMSFLMTIGAGRLITAAI